MPTAPARSGRLRLAHQPVVLRAGWGRAWCATELLAGGVLLLRPRRVAVIADPTGLLAGPLLRAAVQHGQGRACTLAPMSGYWEGLLRLLTRRAGTPRRVAERARVLSLPDRRRTLAAVLPPQRVGAAERRPARRSAGASAAPGSLPFDAASAVAGAPDVDVPPATLARWLEAGAAVVAVGPVAARAERALTSAGAVGAGLDLLTHTGCTLTGGGAGRSRWRRRARRRRGATRPPAPRDAPAAR